MKTMVSVRNIYVCISVWKRSKYIARNAGITGAHAMYSNSITMRPPSMFPKSRQESESGFTRSVRSDNGRHDPTGTAEALYGTQYAPCTG